MSKVFSFLDNFVESQFKEASFKSYLFILGIIIFFFYLHFFNLVPFLALTPDPVIMLNFLDSGQRIDFSDATTHHQLRWGSYAILYFLSLFTGGFSLELITITSGVSFFIAISILSLVCLREIGFFPALCFLLFVFTSKALNLEIFSWSVVNQALIPLSLLVLLICELTKNPNLKLGPIYMALLCFWLYGVKETNLFFFPLLLFLNFFFSNKSFYLKAILTFVSLLILETFLIYIFSENNYPFGRLVGLMSSSSGHLQVMKAGEYTPEQAKSIGSIENTFLIFYRWYSARGWDTTIIYFSSILSILFLFGRNEKLLPKIISSLILSFFFFTTFFIVSIFPPVLGQPMHTRFLTILLPLSYLIICFGIKELILNAKNKFMAISFFSLILFTFMSKPVYQLIFVDGDWGYLSLKSHYGFSVRDRREQLEEFYEILKKVDCVQLVSENHELHEYNKTPKHGTNVDLLLHGEHIFLGSEKNDFISRPELKDFYDQSGSLWLRKDDLFVRKGSNSCNNIILLRDNGFSLPE